MNEPALNTVLSSLNGTAKLTRNDSDLLTYVKIVFGDEPDTIYNNWPQQYPVELICLIGGVIYRIFYNINVCKVEKIYEA